MVTVKKGTDWRERLWFFDTEVLPNDWLLNALSKDGERVSFHNDPVGVHRWIEDTQPFLCGYNSKHYDMYILKAILAGATPQDIKVVNDHIIGGGWGWEIDMGYISTPFSCDLMLDLPTRPSLKMIEGNLKMSIDESSVDFNTENPTEEEWQSIVDYCWHDVEALPHLFEARLGYVEAKETLATMANLDIEKSLNMTNAKLTAQFLGANLVERDDKREYQYPQKILDKTEYIPLDVIQFFNRLPNSDIPLDILFGREGIPDEDGKIVKSRNPYRNLETTIGGIPTVVAWGGLHGARERYEEKKSEHRSIFNFDVQSFYPSLMIKENYLSRNVHNARIFEDTFHTRLQAKESGDKATSDALKLVLNTTFGASNNKYNELYDPLMARSICISGQLYLILLTEMLYRSIPNIEFIQLNTDGIMFSVDNESVESVREIVKEWETYTEFNMEEDEIEHIIQRDVNNYVMRDIKGKITVKGGVVKDYKGGDFISNSLSVVAKAIVYNLLDGKPIEDTIYEETDIHTFQMIVKSGGTFEKVVHEIGGIDFEVNRVNRIYAGVDKNYGMVYKVKDGNKHKVPNCPPNAIVDNSNQITIDSLDREWYIELALQRVQEFLKTKSQIRKEKKMAEEKKSTTVAFKEKLFNLATDMQQLARGFVKDGYNQGQQYEYVRSSQYKDILQKALVKNRLLFKLDDLTSNVSSEAVKSDKMTLTSYYGVATISDLDSDEIVQYQIWSQGADTLDKGLSKAKTFAIKDFVKANFLIDDNQDDPEGDVEPVKDKKAPAKKYVSPEKKKEIQKEIMKEIAEDTEMADEKTVERIEKGILAIREASSSKTYGSKALKEIKEPITVARATVILSMLEVKGASFGVQI